MAMTFWTREEESRLVRELRDGLTIEDIATAHQRTQSAILARASRMAPQDLDLQTRAQRSEWLREQLLTDPDYDWAASLAATRRRQHEETRANAPRHGKAWTQADDEQVLAAATTGVSIRDLAAQLQRSPKSTARRIYDLVHRDDATSPAEEPTSPASPASPAPSSTTSKKQTAVAPATSAPGATATAATATAGTGGPSAHGQSWTEEETGRLLEELRRGLLVEDIAAAHHRSLRAIHGRAAIVLTELTGIKHPLRENSAALLRRHLNQAAGPTKDDGQEAVAVLRDVLGATPIEV